EALAQSGAAAVMIGRGAQGRPWAIGQVGEALAGRNGPLAPSGEALAELIVEHYEGELEEYGLDVGVRASRKHLDWYLEAAGIAMNPQMRGALLNSTEPQEVKRLIRTLCAEPMRQ